MKVGFIGTGWIGKNLANNFEERGYKDIIRYSLEEPYIKNKEKIKECDIVFLAVPTPTTPDGFNDSCLRDAIPLVRPGAIVVIKSTILPLNLFKLYRDFSKHYILLCPEFLTTATAKHDTDNPERNIVGIPTLEDKEYYQKAEEVIKILPQAPYELICTYEEASLIKYGGNCYLYNKNLFFNILHDIVEKCGGNWDVVQEGITHDSRIQPSHTVISHKGGRGAGGECLIKDFAAIVNLWNEIKDEESTKDILMNTVLKSQESLNRHLLKTTNKDIDLLKGVYGNGKS